VFTHQVFTHQERITNMKIKPESLLQAALLFCALAAFTTLAGCLTGCTTTATGEKKFTSLFFITGTTNNIEAKAFRVSRLVVHEVLKDRGTNALPKLQNAADDLKLLEASPTITPEQVLEVLNRAKVIKNPDTAFYVTEGILLMTDDVGTIGAQSPEQLRAAARGGYRGIESILANRQ
jgi:hypothetical protein